MTKNVLSTIVLLAYIAAIVILAINVHWTFGLLLLFISLNSGEEK